MRPLRILHVVGSLTQGGVETWLVNVLRHSDRSRFEIDFLTLTGQPQAYDAEVRALGSSIFPCAGYKQPWQFARNFRRIVKAHGPYDILHCHFQEYSGLIMWLAQQAHIPVRITHSHSDMLPRWVQAGLWRRFYIHLMQYLIARYATLRLAVSQQAATRLFESTGSPWHLLPCSIDLEPFAAPVDALAVRREWGLPSDTLVLGHVGRFVPAKNHRFLLDLTAHMVAADHNIRLLLVGDGPLHSTIEQQVFHTGLERHVVFAGARPDVARLMRGAMDILVLPSHYEGLGLVGIEAQAAGLPCLFSTRVPPEADIVTPLVQRLALSQPLHAWANAVLTATRQNAPINQPQALRAVQERGYDIRQGMRHLEALYYAEIPHGCTD